MRCVDGHRRGEKSRQPCDLPSDQAHDENVRSRSGLRYREQGREFLAAHPGVNVDYNTQNPSGNTLGPKASPSGSTLTPTGSGAGLNE
jgi:hypothetical protein